MRAIEGAAGESLSESGNDIEIKRFAECTGFLGAVEDGDGFDGRREFTDEVFSTERTVETHLENADFFALSDEVVSGFAGGVCTRTHENDDTFCIGGTVIFHQFVSTSCERAEIFHRRFDDAGQGVVERINGFATLEIDVRVLGGSAYDGTLWIQTSLAVGEDGFFADHFTNNSVRDLVDFIDFVRGAETIEVVDERNARIQCSHVRNEGEVVGFLNGTTAENGKSCLSNRHDVLVVTEDRKSLCGDGACGDVEYGSSELARDFIHVGNHQQ